MVVAILVCSLLSVSRILALYIGEKIYYIPYFLKDNVSVIYTKKSKFVKNEHAQYTCERYER
jgi:hypothetical protein